MNQQSICFNLIPPYSHFLFSYMHTEPCLRSKTLTGMGQSLVKLKISDKSQKSHWWAGRATTERISLGIQRAGYGQRLMRIHRGSKGTLWIYNIVCYLLSEASGLSKVEGPCCRLSLGHFRQKPILSEALLVRSCGVVVSWLLILNYGTLLPLHKEVWILCHCYQPFMAIWRHYCWILLKQFYYWAWSSQDFVFICEPPWIFVD